MTFVSSWLVILVLSLSCFAEAHADIIKSKLTAAEQQIANDFSISALLLEKIAEAESAFNPYALHLQSYLDLRYRLTQLKVPFKYYFKYKKHHYQVMPTSKKQAVLVIKNVLPNCVRYDVGKYQISHLKMQDLHIQPLELLDYKVSAYWASKILRDCYDKEGSLWKTVECYHRGSSKERLTKYTNLVYRSYLGSVYPQ